MSFSSINADTIDNIVVRLQVGHISHITMEHRVIKLIFCLCEYVKKSDRLTLRARTRCQIFQILSV